MRQGRRAPLLCRITHLIPSEALGNAGGKQRQESVEWRLIACRHAVCVSPQEDFTIHVTKGSGEDEVIVNMRTRSQSKGGMDGNERIMAFLNELQEVCSQIDQSQSRLSICC